MSVESVKDYLKEFHWEDRVKELNVSCATVELAAAALNTEAARIAKTISFKKDDGCILVVTSGDMKIDNKKFKDTFGVKAKMLTPEEAIIMTGHAVGGVCPFDLPSAVPVFLDESLKRFTTIFPACGSSNSLIELTPDELGMAAKSQNWVDICKCRE